MAANTQPLSVAQDQLEKLAEVFTPADGLDYVTHVSRMAPASLADATNYRIENGYYRPREGTTYLGVTTDTIMATMLFVRPGGLEYPFRFTVLKGQFWDGASWQQINTMAFTGDNTQYFSWTSYGDNLLVTNGKDGIWSIDAPSHTGTLLASAPAARFITAFGGRVVSSNQSTHPTRIQWSVKNSSTDWSGTGSGFDDLIATPGGVVDETYGVYPINDTQALIVRQNSIWMMSLTGDANAPFRFSQLYNNLGTNTPYSVVTVPGGIVGLFKDNIYFVNEAGFQAIGDPIKSKFVDNNVSGVTSARPVGAYDQELREYRLLITLNDSGQQIFRYSFLYQKWMKDKYPLNIRHINGLHKPAVSMLGRARLLMSGNSYSFYEDNNALTDVSGNGGVLDSGTELRTGVIHAADPYHMTRLTKVFVEFDNPLDAVFMTANYSLNGGANWNTYGPLNLLAGVGSQLAFHEVGVEHRNIQLQLTTPTLARFKLLGALLRVTAGNEEPR